MNFRILFDETKLKGGLYQQDDNSNVDLNGVSWPKGTWFQMRLRHVREQNRRKPAEAELVYECALGTITIRHSNQG